MLEFVYNWNKERNNLNNFNRDLEFNMLLEEVIELKVSNKEKVKIVINLVNNLLQLLPDNDKLVSERQFEDGLGDLEFLLNGARCKHLIYLNGNISYDKIQKIVNSIKDSICRANELKGKNKTEDGKIIKDASFKEPFIPLCVFESQLLNNVNRTVLSYDINPEKVDENVKLVTENSIKSFKINNEEDLTKDNISNIIIEYNKILFVLTDGKTLSYDLAKDFNEPLEFVIAFAKVWKIDNNFIYF